MRIPIKTLWKTSNVFKKMVVIFFLHVVVFFFLLITGLVGVVKQEWVGLVFIILAGRESWWISKLAQELDRVRGYRSTY
jgi:hypothetical protein